MPDYYDSRRGRRRDIVVAGSFLLLSIVLIFVPAPVQGPIRQAVQSTALRPFIAAQEGIAARRSEGVDVSDLRAQRDSLSALVAAEGNLGEENRRLRGLLGLAARAGADFIPAEVLRLGSAGTESTFLINKGRLDGVKVGSPIVSAGGLLGVVLDASDHSAQAIDWTHPDFRTSAMTADGETYGIVEPRRGRYREEDMLALTGAPFHTDLPTGTRVVTSGRGGLYPRGIPIGVVVGIEEADTGWRKSYLLRPLVRPEGNAHILVAISSAAPDLSQLWHVTAAPDTVGTGSPDTAGTPARRPRPTTPVAPGAAPQTPTTTPGTR